MTDPADLDDLASAHLDGHTSPEEAARVAADPELQARVEELRAVRAALHELPPVDPARREAAISAALAAFDEDRAPGEVTVLTPRRRLSPRALGALGAAAAIVVLALLAPRLTDGDGSDDEAASFDATGDVAEEAAGPLAEASTTTIAPTAGATGGGTDAFRAPSLGTFDDLDALAGAVATAAASGDLEERAAAEDASDGGAAGRSAPCQAVTPSTVVGTAVVAGEAVEVYVDTADDGTRTMTVVARDTCELLDERPL
jgi:hypothetical protein